MGWTGDSWQERGCQNEVEEPKSWTQDQRAGLPGWAWEGHVGGTAVCEAGRHSLRRGAMEHWAPPAGDHQLALECVKLKVPLSTQWRH